MFKNKSASNLYTNGNSGGGGNIKKSHTMDNCIVEKKRGFKPSDRHDPSKKQFLTHLSQQIWQKNNETTNVSKKIDLHKIFTPATDAEEILPKNRKLYASSAFYSPTLHPTVEDQVELARRISHSLSDISNQQSRGQSMYVNRKKRSVKWIHEGCGQGETVKTSTTETISQQIANEEECAKEEKENNVACHHEKVPLKYLMNPCGQMRDINSLRESLNTETGLLSPDVSAEVVTALQTQKGKGAELFAKRRKVSEKWIVDESNVGAQSPSGLPDYHQCQQQPKQSTSPSILPAYTDAAKHRVQLNLHQEQLMEKYAKPGLKVVQTPWEAALSSGSASAAFIEEQKLSPLLPNTSLTPSPTPQLYDASQGSQTPYQGASVTANVRDSYVKPYSTTDYQKYTMNAQSQHKLPQTQIERHHHTESNSLRELAYKPSIPQGWKAPSMSLPKVKFEQHHSGYEVHTNEEILHTKQQQQQQQNYFTAINEAAKKCEEFNTKDEIEIIDLIRDVKVTEIKSSLATSTSISSQATLKPLSNTEKQQFITHLIKSPELTVSPIPITTQIIYDNAVKELCQKQQQHLQQSDGNTVCDDNETEMKVNVRKQLQQYEDLHQQHAEQMKQDELIHKKRREVAKLKAMQRNHNISNNNLNHKENNTVSLPAPIEEEQAIEPIEYFKIPVKELINNFEQQALQQDDKQNHPPSINAYLQEIENNGEETEEEEEEDLYMPKDIPLQSYAPPPVAAISPSVSSFSNTGYESSCQSFNQGHTYKPASTASYSSPAPAQFPTKSFNGNGFSFSKQQQQPQQQGLATSFGSNQPPKQQYLPPQSYQTVPQNSSQNVPQVNFNPSPLPYDKLAKFENPPPSDDNQHIHSPLFVRGSKVRNTSPSPFAGSYQRPYTPSFESYNYGAGGTGSKSPASLQHYSGNITPSVQLNVTSNQILNAPSYNSLARGWGCSDATTAYHDSHQPSHISASKPQIVNAASIPYTDF